MPKVKYPKQKLILFVAALFINALCLLSVVIFTIETTHLKVIGSFAAVVIVGVLALPFPFKVYGSALFFVFFAASLGSCVNLYRHIQFYDRFVHFLSGILMAYVGYIVINFIFKKRKLPDDKLIKVLFASIFSCSCAAFWEIYEFTADQLINANMQGSNTNTMGDIISGVLGALLYFIVYLLLGKRKHR